LALWSGFTALCGFAQSYTQLFLLRLGVGIGEAGGVAPSYALIADYFPPERRGRALAIYSLGIPIGLACGTLMGAYLAALLSWRAAFLTMGVAGVALAPVMLLLVRDLPKAQRANEGAHVPLRQVFPLLARKPSFWLLALASSCSSLSGYGLALWTPSVIMRSYGLSLVATGQFVASLLLIGGTAGVFGGGWLADRLGSHDRRWYPRLPAIAWLITAPSFVLAFTSHGLFLVWPLLLIPNALNILWLGPVTNAVQHLAPQRMRATASASFLLINNLIGLGVGPLLIGMLSDHFKARYAAESLRYAAMASTAFYLVAAALAFCAIRTIRRDWVNEESA
jgi:MFS family permease